MNSESTEPKKIAVIGPTQSGKTCLAVGLFATNTSGFTIETVDIDGRSYLVDLQAALEPGRDDAGKRKTGLWPAATNKGTKKDIRLDFQKKGKAPIRVAFPEFSGELLADDETFRAFANQHLRDLSGVVLLMNPGADAFQSGDAKKLADAMTQYKRVIDFLKDPNNGSSGAFVALTVTAADRLKGDLRGKLEAFNQTIKELSNSIGTAELSCKRFNVSITGRLKEQDDPQLARGRKNSASEPFLWLLDELDWRPRRQARLRKIRRCALAAVAIVAIAGVWCGVDAWNSFQDIRTTENELQKALDDCDTRNNPSESDLDAARKPLAALRARRSIWFRKYASDSADDFEPKVWNAHEKRIRHEISAIANDPEKYGGDCGRVDSVFNAWIPSPSAPAVVAERISLKKEWDAAKPGYQDSFAVAQMLESIRKPLRENMGIHGDEAFALFAGLYGKLAATTPSQPKSIALKDEVSAELDGRVEKEWREFAIPDFGNAAEGNATHEATRAFVARLADWNPVTTNGTAAKTELCATVTNAVPGWRTSYETATLAARTEAALKSNALEELAALFPARVATNDYLVASAIDANWTNRVKPAFDSARKVYLGGILDSIQRRRGRPTLTEDDRRRVEETARVVGSPFDADAAKGELEEAVQTKAVEWETDKRKECEDWVRNNVRADRKRTGQNSLWDDYETFMRKNREDNPFAESIVRLAVYRQVESWFESDLRTFEGLRLGDDYAEAVANAFEPFKYLCRRVSEDKLPLKTSWAWHFACDCVNRGKIDSISSCFPQRLSFTKVEGKIVYGDYRIGYLGTDLTATVRQVPVEGDPGENNLVSAQTLGKSQNGRWSPLSFVSQSVLFHPFDVVGIVLYANDRNFPGRNLECKVETFAATGLELGATNWSDGIEFGGEFDLSDATIIASKEDLTTRDPTPDAFLRVYGSVSGDSIHDFLSKAKAAAAREKERAK